MGVATVFGSRSAVVLLAAAWCLPAAGQAVSFSRQVAPILAAKCGGCHVGGRKGNFHMPSYAALMQTGMVQRGAGNSSRLVEVILSGDMPRGGGKVSSDEVGVLMKWIDGGAPFDGPDPTMALDAVARGGAAAPKPAAVAVPAGPVALRPGDVSFSFDVVPVLLKQCAGCHGADDPEARLSMASLESMLRGGRSGAPIVPGSSGESLLVKKIRGRDIEGQRMPLGREPLGDPVIAMIAKWIDQGARLDLLTARTPLEVVAAAGRARSMSNDELSKIRFAAAPKVWRRAIPDESPVVEEHGPLCIVGNLPEARMEELSKAASSLEERARRDVVADGQPLLKGGVVLFVFRQSYDYSALWQSLVGGERPKGVTGNAGVSGDVAYGAMIVPANDPDGENTRLLLAEQLVAAASAGRGLPAWFSRGVGRAVAARVVPKASLAQEWRKEVPAALQKIGSTADFFDGHADPGAMAVAGGGFVGALASTGGRLRPFFKLVDEGLAFDDAFTKIFRATPQQAFEAWAVKESRKPGR